MLGASQPLVELAGDGDTRMSRLLAGIFHPVGKMAALDFLGFQLGRDYERAMGDEAQCVAFCLWS